MKQTCRTCNVDKAMSAFPKLRSGNPFSRCQKCIDAERYRKNPRKEQSRHLVRKYGITLDDYDRMLRLQNGRCDICRCLPKETMRFHVDHDHQTGRVRGLLCRTCNYMLGSVQDNPVTLMMAVYYLEKHGQ